MKKNNNLTCKRIAAGCYNCCYNGIQFRVVKVEHLPNWYFQIGNQTVDDWQNSKKEAIEAAKYVIDHPEEYT